MYGDLCGRDFTIEQMTLAVTLPDGEGETTGYIYVEIDTSSEDVITLNSALAPFTPTYEDINTNGAVAQMVLAEYTASAVAVTSVTPVYPKATAGSLSAGSVATVENAQAVASHSAGDYILLGGKLYLVTAAVSVGETFVEGTNIEAAVIGDALTALNNGLTRNKKGTTVDLSNRTTDYTFPSDGYLIVSATSTANAVAIVDLRDSNSSYIGALGGQGNSNYPSWTTFVRAGMVVRIRTVSNSGYVAFVPLVS